MRSISSHAIDYYRQLLCPVLEGKKLILAMGVIAGMTKMVDRLQQLGVERCLLIGASEGTGELPDPTEIPWVVAGDRRPANFLEGIRIFEAALSNPSRAVIDAVEAFDPTGEALLLCSHVSDIEELLGRPRLGPRRATWTTYEDKVVIDAFWRRAGVDCAPSRVIDADDRSACLQATRDLDWGNGSVLAGDAREGFNGGARYIRHIRCDADLDEAHRFFRAHCDRIRAMPFLQGVPCSIHAMVFPEQTIAFRPVEMIVFQRPNSPELLYAGTSTWWDPADEIRRQMRSIARRVGQQLSDEVDYRGAFTVDGIVTTRGFLPTELNPRAGGAFSDLYAGERRLPLGLLDMCVRQGLPLDYKPARLEELVLAIADGHRSGGGRVVVAKRFKSTETFNLSLQRSVRIVDSDEDGHIQLTIGPSDVGGFVGIRPTDGYLQEGTFLAPRIAEVLRFADEHFGTDIGAISAATPVDSSPR